MATLDITISQFQDAIESDENCATLESEGLDQYVVQMVTGLPENKTQIYTQQLASMSDLSMHRVVQICGNDPLD
jgi:hypothetical protein